MLIGHTKALHPCLPAPWSWIQCNLDTQPRVISIKLSQKNLTGNIPTEFAELGSLVAIWLDGNSFSGPIPDFSGCPNLKIIHIEDNQLTRELPSSLAVLSNLRELYVQNNKLSGSIPSDLLSKGLTFKPNNGLRMNMVCLLKGSSRHLGILQQKQLSASVCLNLKMLPRTLRERSAREVSSSCTMGP